MPADMRLIALLKNVLCSFAVCFRLNRSGGSVCEVKTAALIWYIRFLRQAKNMKKAFSRANGLKKQCGYRLRILNFPCLRIPTPEERKCKEHAAIIDTERSYKEYLDEQQKMKIDVYTRSIR